MGGETVFMPRCSYGKGVCKCLLSRCVCDILNAVQEI